MMHCKKRQKHAEMKARNQTFLEASLAAAKESITHSNIEGLELPKQKEINDQKFVEKVELTYEEICKGIEKELKIEQDKAEVDRSKIDDANKEICKANPEQLFLEVVTEIVDQRMKMEDDGNKEEANKGIPWLIESLKGKRTHGKFPGGVRRGRKCRGHPRTTAWAKAKDSRAQQTKPKAKAKVKFKRKAKPKGKPKTNRNPLKAKTRTKAKESVNHTKAKAKRAGQAKRNTKEKAKAKTEHDFHSFTCANGMARAFPDQTHCILVAQQKDHEARNLEAADERAKNMDPLQNIGGAKIQIDHEGREWT